MYIKKAYRIVPVYTGDVSGVCSALYELGGMVVMHDPSGCNSTYNTHDETRWYDQDSLIYLSGLTEIDAVMGNDRKFVEDVVEAAKRMSPRFIALCNSPIPFLNGTDFRALSRMIEKKTGIPTFHCESNGMHDYIMGAGGALECLVEKFLMEPETPVKVVKEKTLNILGATPLDYTAETSMDSLRQILAEGGWSVQSCWSLGADWEELLHSADACVNLVVSAVGMKAAEAMRKRWGIPYVVGAPLGEMKKVIFKDLEQALLTGENQISCNNIRKGEGKTVTFLGEAVTMGSLASAVSMRYGCSVRVVCPLEGSAGLLASEDLAVHGEQEIEDAIKDAEILVADGLYEPICPEGCEFRALAHEACSGRVYWQSMPDLFRLLEE